MGGQFGLASLGFGRDIASERVTYEQNVLFFVDHPQSCRPIGFCFCVVHVRVIIVLAALQARVDVRMFCMEGFSYGFVQINRKINHKPTETTGVTLIHNRQRGNLFLTPEVSSIVANPQVAALEIVSSPRP